MSVWAQQRLVDGKPVLKSTASQLLLACKAENISLREVVTTLGREEDKQEAHEQENALEKPEGRVGHLAQKALFSKEAI